MRFINVLRLLMKNFKQVVYLFISKAITALVVIALCAAFILPELLEIVESSAAQALYKDFMQILPFHLEGGAPYDPVRAINEIFQTGGSLSQFWTFLVSESVNFIPAIVGCVLVYLVKCFVDEVVHFTVGRTLNDKMATYAETPFGTAFVANLGKASNYAWLYALVTVVTDGVALGLIVVFLRFVPLVLALFLSMTAIVALQALKMTLTGSWMPAMTTDDRSLKGAIADKEVFSKSYFSKTYMLYIVLVYLVIILNVVAAVCTCGSALLLTVPMSYLLFISAQYVNYYTMQGKKYFITYERIESNLDHGDHAHFFDYLEEKEECAAKEEGIMQEECVAKEEGTVQETAPVDEEK